MLVGFSPIFVVDTKIIFRRDFVASSKSQGWFEILVLCNRNCFQRRSCPKQGKKQQNIGIKSFDSNTSYASKYEKTA